ncbi:hypothetical protein MIR68_007525 [Amoeboaphelidium protococcarum]|nr:hypothetical protein MIR68_007525 [Amoeboaphelidium protococcarum]
MMKSFLNVAIIVSVVSSVPLPGKQEQGGVGKAGFGGFEVAQPAQSQAHQVVGYPYASAGSSYQYPPQQHADNGVRMYGQRNQGFGTIASQAQYPTMQGMQHGHDARQFHQLHYYGQKLQNGQTFQVVSQSSRQDHGRNAYGSVVPFPDLGYASNPVAPLPNFSPILTGNVGGQGQGVSSLGPDYPALPDVDGVTGNLPDTLGGGGDFGAADCGCAGCCVIS